MAINFRGYLFQDDGDAVSGATVQLLETGTTTVEASTTTDSDGLWYFNEGDQDRYDVKITSGTSIRYIRWDDQISVKELDVRNNTGNTTPAATFTNLTNNAANQVAVFSGANSTKADDDEIYLSFKMHDSAGNLDEFARMTVVATDVTDGEEDGQIEFDVMKSGTFTKVWTVTSSTAGAMSFDMNVDALTIGSGADTDISLTFDANSADGVITWMEDEDYFKFSDDILMNSTERINFYDTAIYIYSSTDGQLDLVADTEIQIAATTIDINGAVAFNGALTGITNITLSGTLSDGNYTFDTSGNVSGLGTVGSGNITSTGTVQGTTITATTAFVPDASDGAALGTTSLEFSDLYLADGAVVGFGDDQEVTLTHVHDAGLLLSSTDKLQFGDSGTFIHQSADGVLTIESDTTVDINGAVALNGAVTGATNITLSGELDAATLDISGNADIDGTTNLDAVDIDGAVQIDAAFTSGVDGQGYDTKFFGDTSGAYILWDTSADKLLTAGGAVIDIVKDKLLIGGTAVTATAAELNLLDTASANSVVNSKAVIYGSSGELAGTLSTAAQTNVTSVGALDGGSITSGFGTIDTGSSTITTTGVITAGGFTIGSAAILEAELEILDGASVTTTELNYLDITTLGTSEASKAVTVDSNGDLLVPDSDKYKFGAGSDMQLYHDGTDSYMTNATGALKIATETSGIAVTIGHTTSETTVADNLSVTGTVFINESANTFMDNGPGMTINQGAADDEIISLKSSDIAHGMTSAANTETDTYGAFGKVDGNANAGGLQITGYSESIVGLALQGRATTANTTDGTGARGAVEVEAKLKSSTTTTGYGNSDNALVVRNNETAEFIVKGDGELYSNQSATVATFDEYDDAQLVRAFDLAHGKGVIDSRFDEFIEYNREKLADLKLIGRDEDGSPNKFVNVTRMQRLHNGAIWQGYERQMELQERVEELETKLLALEGAK